jgi:hypothetical protein
MLQAVTIFFMEKRSFAETQGNIQSFQLKVIYLKIITMKHRLILN